MGEHDVNYPHLWQAFLTSLFLLGYYSIACVFQFFISRRLRVPNTGYKAPSTNLTRPQRNPTITVNEVTNEGKKEEEKKASVPKTQQLAIEDKKETKDEKLGEDKQLFRPRRAISTVPSTTSSSTTNAGSSSASTTAPQVPTVTKPKQVFNTRGDG